MIRLKTAAASLALAGLFLAACGSEPASSPRPAEIRWTASKPGSPVGSLKAAVVERPALDRAWVEVQWQKGHTGTSCEVTIDLTGGALLIEGEAKAPVDPSAASGTHRWLVEFPVATELYALVRYCGETEQGHRAAEAAVLLTE